MADNEVKIQVRLDVIDDKIDALEKKIDSLDDEPITPAVETTAAMASIEQIGQGFDRLKQGASEIGEKMGVALEAAGKQETNKVFLQQAIGAEKAGKAMEDINSVVQKLPGDDTVMQGLLGQAVAKDASMTTQELEAMGGAAADYFSAMSYYGKSSSEAFQDMNNYLMTGNTAEIERSPILANHIDKLKEGTTVQERSKLLQEALNEEHWGGVSAQDTYNNKLETFNGMLERGQYNLGGMFQEGAKSAMDFALQLDDASGGLVGMGLAALSFASPVTDAVMGLGQMATGMKAIKDLGMIKYLKELEITTKLSAAADWLLSGAQAVLNFIMSMNPIVLVVLALVALAAALIWAYYNVDWFREMVDNAWASIVQFAQGIWSYISPAIDWLSSLFTNFTSQLGLNTNDWIQAIIGFLLFIPQLPIQLGIALVNAIARLFGFKGNFVQTMLSTGINAVSNFINQIAQLPSKLAAELQRMYSTVSEWAATLPQKFWDAGVNAVKNFLNALGIHSPGFMFYAMQGELARIDKVTDEADFSDNITSMGQSMANSFNPNLDFYGNGSSAGAGMNLTINIESVDSEDRINQIVRAVEEALAFDNETAGRNV